MGSSSQIANVVATQRRMLPGMAINTTTDIVCVTINDVPTARTRPASGAPTTCGFWSRSSFTPITPIVSMFGSHTFESYSRVRYYP